MPLYSEYSFFKNDRVQTLPEPKWFMPDLYMSAARQVIVSNTLHVYMTVDW